MADNALINGRITLPAVQKLERPTDWVEWFSALKTHARNLGIWDMIDPAETAKPSDAMRAPEYPTEQDAIQVLQERADDDELEPSEEAIDRQLGLLAKRHAYDFAQYQESQRKQTAIRTWIVQTVEQNIYQEAVLLVESSGPLEGAVTLRALVLNLKGRLAPSDATIIEQVRNDYRASLAEAKRANSNIQAWYARWYRAHTRARVYAIPEVQGNLGIRDFLGAVGARFAPEWAREQLRALVLSEQLGEGKLPVGTLAEYGQWFETITSFQAEDSKRGGIFSTLGDLSDTPNQSDNRPNHRSHPHQGHKSLNKCPCGSEHPWKPLECSKLEIALTGKSHRKLRYPLKPARIAHIKNNIQSSEWEGLRPTLISKGWIKQDNAQEAVEWPGKVVCTILDPEDIYGKDKALGVYTALSTTQHPLSQSTLLDNCGALHLVNTIDLLEPGTFQPSTGKFVEAGTTDFPIIGYGKRVIRKILNGPRGERSEDLELSNVAVVEGFHTNIVSEALLHKKGIWYAGFDCSLRFGTPVKSSIIANLIRKHNVTLLEYKPLEDYHSTGSSMRQ